MNSPLDFLDEEDNGTEVAAAPEESPESTTPEPVTTTTAPAVVENDNVQPNEQGMVPHAALHAARQREKARVAGLEAEIAALRSGKTLASTETVSTNSATVETEEEEFKPPSFTEDPVAWAEHQEQINALRALNVNLNNSERFARDKFGSEKVDEGLKWLHEMRADYPDTYKRIVYHADPYKVMIELHEKVKQQETFAGLESTEVEAFKAWKAAQSQVNNERTTMTTTPAVRSPNSGQFTKPTPPQSLANAPSDGKPVLKTSSTEPGSAFDNIFS